MNMRDKIESVIRGSVPTTNEWEVALAADAIIAALDPDALVWAALERAADQVRYAENAVCAKCGKPRNNHPYRHPFASRVSDDHAANILALSDYPEAMATIKKNAGWV